MPQDIETKKKIVAEYPDMTWEKFLRMEELRGCPIELILDMNKIPCKEISAAEVLSAQPLVSVSMITFNHEKYIEEAINGVVNQQCKFPFELIIGEDCSTDRTREICLEYQKKYPHIIRVLFSEKNVGSARNSRRATMRARGKYLAFCEGDDYWTDMSKLQIQVDALEQNPEIGMIATSYSVKHELTGEFKTIDTLPTKNIFNFYEDVLILNEPIRIQTAGIMIRTHKFLDALKNDIIFRCLLRCGDIQMFMASTYPNGQYIFNTQKTYVYRIHPAGASFGNNQYCLYFDGTLCKFYFMMKISKTFTEQDIFYKYYLAVLHYNFLNNLQEQIPNEILLNDFLKMIQNIVLDGQIQYPLTILALQKVPFVFFKKPSLSMYVKRICTELEKLKIPLYDSNSNKIMRWLTNIFSYYTCVKINHLWRKISPYLLPSKYFIR